MAKRESKISLVQSAINGECGIMGPDLQHVAEAIINADENGVDIISALSAKSAQEPKAPAGELNQSRLSDRTELKKLLDSVGPEFEGEASALWAQGLSRVEILMAMNDSLRAKVDAALRLRDRQYKELYSKIGERVGPPPEGYIDPDVRPSMRSQSQSRGGMQSLIRFAKGQEPPEFRHGDETYGSEGDGLSTPQAPANGAPSGIKLKGLRDE